MQECCNYGAKGTATKGFDCVSIPGARKSDATLNAGDNADDQVNFKISSYKYLMDKFIGHLDLWQK